MVTQIQSPISSFGISCGESNMKNLHLRELRFSLTICHSVNVLYSFIAFREIWATGLSLTSPKQLKSSFVIFVEYWIRDYYYITLMITGILRLRLVDLLTFPVNQYYEQKTIFRNLFFRVFRLARWKEKLCVHEKFDKSFCIISLEKYPFPKCHVLFRAKGCGHSTGTK
jgi:hypothetical protein